jgi:PAS domain S-box-containing protein
MFKKINIRKKEILFTLSVLLLLSVDFFVYFPYREHILHFVVNTATLAIFLLIIFFIYKKQRKYNLEFQKFKLAVDNTLDHIVITNPEGIILYANSAAEKITGYSKEEMIGNKAGSPKLWGGHMSKDFYQKMWQVIKEDKKPFKGEIKNRRKSGEYYFANSNISPIKDYKGELLFFVSTERDITDDKKLVDFSEKNKALIDSIGEITYDHLVTEKKIIWEGLDSIGFTKEDFGEDDSSWFKHCHPDDLDKVEKELDNAIKEKRPYNLQYRFATKNDGYIWVRDQGTTFFDEAGSLTRIVGILKNIDKHEKQLQEIKDLNNRLSLAKDSANIGVWDLDLKTNKLNWDNNMYKIYGLSHDFDLTYNNWVENLFPEDSVMAENAFKQAVESGENFNAAFRINRKKDNSVRYIEAHAIIIKDDKGKPNRAIGVNIDVTKEKEVDKAKSEFVSLASHQLRTPLSAIRWYTELMLDKSSGKTTKKQKEYLKEIMSGSQRMIDLVNSLLNVSRLETGTFKIEPVESDIIKVSKEILKEIKIIAKESNVKLTSKFEKDLPEIKIDAELMTIILQNLLTNAVKYSHVKNGKVNFNLTKDDKSLIMKIEDNGLGIPENQQDKVFTKMFRADNAKKAEVGGSGLGLYLIKLVIDKIGGEISFESEENKGTTFTVKIPLSGMKEQEGTRKLT